MKIKLPTNFSMETIRELTLIKWIKKVANSNIFANFFIKTFASIIILFFTFIPIYFYLGVRWLIGPSDFWQEFAILVVACLTIGWLQVGIGLLAGILIFIIILEDI